MQKFQSAPVIIGVVFISFFVAVILVSADWAAPLAAPPACVAGNPGCDPPLHTGSATQSKKGGLILGDFGGAGGLTVLNGNVGIGVAPTQKLDIAGDMQLSGLAPTIYFNESDKGDPDGWWRVAADNTNFSIRKKITVGTWAGEAHKMRITGAGNVEFHDVSSVTADFNDDTAVGTSFSAYKKRIDATGSAQRTVHADALLHLRGYAWDGDTNEEAGRISIAVDGVVADGVVGDEMVPGKMMFYVASNANPAVLTQRMTIKSDGNVGIGTAAPTEKLHVNGNITATKVYNAVYAP